VGVRKAKYSLQASLFSFQGWGLIDLPLRAFNEGSLRPRVARAQKIIRLRPLLCSASKEGTWMLPAIAWPCTSVLQVVDGFLKAMERMFKVANCGLKARALLAASMRLMGVL
jgi:hypothetical protein